MSKKTFCDMCGIEVALLDKAKQVSYSRKHETKSYVTDRRFMFDVDVILEWERFSMYDDICQTCTTSTLINALEELKKDLAGEEIAKAFNGEQQ